MKNTILLFLLTILLFSCSKSKQINKDDRILSLKYKYKDFEFEGLRSVGNEKFGYVDSLDSMVIPMIYDGAFPFKNGIAKVQKGDLFGYINKKGEITLPIKYKSIARLNDDYFMLFLNQDKKSNMHTQIINAKGEVLFEENKTGYDWEYEKIYKDYVLFSKDDKVNNEHRKRYILFDLKKKKPFLKDTSIIELRVEGSLAYVKKDISKREIRAFEKFIGHKILKKNGAELVFRYSGGVKKLENLKMFEYIRDPRYEGGYYDTRIRGHVSIYNLDKGTSFSSKWDYIRHLTSKYYKVEYDDLYGVIDDEGKLIIPAKYKEIEFLELYNQKLIFALNNEVGSSKVLDINNDFKVIDKGAIKLIDEKEGVYLNQKDKKTYLKNLTTGEQSEIPYEISQVETYHFKDNSILCEEGEESFFYFYKTKEKYSVPGRYRYNDIEFKSGNKVFKVSVKESGYKEYGYINTKGEEVFSPVFSQASNFNGKFATAYKYIRTENESYPQDLILYEDGTSLDIDQSIEPNLVYKNFFITQFEAVVDEQGNKIGDLPYETSGGLNFYTPTMGAGYCRHPFINNHGFMYMEVDLEKMELLKEFIYLNTD